MRKYICSLLAMLVLSSLLLAAGGAYIKYEVLQPLGLYQDKSIMELPFLMFTDDALTYMLRQYSKAEEETQPAAPTTVATEPVVTTIPETEPETEPPTEPPTEPVKVEANWFDDALFIGNSLCVGLRNYAPLGEADYFCMIGLNSFNIWDQWIYVKGIGDTTLNRLLDTQTYGKVYIHLGTNECGYPVEMVLSAYQELVDTIREKQPDAHIIIQATITFGRSKVKEYHYMVPETITVLNENLKTLTNGENIHFIDYNPEIVDEEGYLPDAFSSDGCHPSLEGYCQWSQWIWDNACYLGIPDPVPSETEPEG